MLGALFGLVLTLASPASSARINENEVQVLNDPIEGMKSFETWAKQECPDAGLLLGSLIGGVNEANFLESSTWSSSEHVFEAVLTVDHLYGEIAASSRVPIMWKLDKHLKFAFTKEGGKVTVTNDGLGTQPPTQGLDFYEAAMKKAGLDGADCVEDMDCIQAEMDAAGKYLNDEWKKVIKKDKRKITRVLKTSYDSTMIYYAVNAKGEWPKIFYSMISPRPARFTQFVFEGGECYAVTEADMGSPLISKYEKYHLSKKSSAMGIKSLRDAASTIGMATKFARSGMNFAKMVAYGQGETYRQTMRDIGVSAGDPAAIANLFSYCKGSQPGTDPKCKDKKPGRLSWSPTPME